MKSEQKYLLVENNRETGPFTTSQIQARIAAGEIYAETVCIPKSIFSVPASLDKFFQNTIPKPIPQPDLTKEGKDKSPAAPVAPVRKEIDFLSRRNIGIALLVLSVIALLIGFNLDTTVGSEGSRVHNIGLLSNKQNFILFAIAMAVVGAIFMTFGISKSGDAEDLRPLPRQTRNCPYCAETIKAEAVVCRFCNREVQPADIVTPK